MKLFANTSNYAGIDNWYSEDGTIVETTYVNEYGKTIIVVTHSDLVSEMSDERAYLHDGILEKI